MKQLGIVHSPSTSRHQATDGQSESRIKTAKYALKSFSDYNATNWDTSLSAVEFALTPQVGMVLNLTYFFRVQSVSQTLVLE
jgi:hypothetical protein